jgi:hypothetical protein
MFKVLSTLGAKDMTILENNAMQSIATSAGYMTGPLISGITTSVTRISIDFLVNSARYLVASLATTLHVQATFRLCRPMI